MTNKQMSKMRTRLLIIGLILISITLVSCGQSRQEKTIAIFNKLNLIENQKQNYEFRLEPLKYQATGNDSIRIIELEKQLSEDEVVRRIGLAFDEVFSDNEINDIYNFIQTSAFDKFFNSGETYKIIASKFKDIDKEIEEITNNFSELAENKIVELPRKKFEPIQVDREDGFYATVDYNYSTENKDIKLEDKPSLTSKDILEVKKVFSSYNDRPEISIVFTKKGARKFYLLTKENIGKPIAIVIANYIVSIPTVQMEIVGGKASISGDFSEEEIDEMIDVLKGK
jgi:hypothetical protein